MELKEYLKNNLVYLDGGFGTLLQSRGLSAGELPERRNLTHPDLIKGIHLDYYNAGANIVHANTFGANILKFSESELESIISSAAKIANDAKKESIGTQEKWVALDLGPTGRMLKPYGDLDFESAVEIFAKTVRIGAKYGFDLVSIETMNDSYETKAALLAAKENCSLPVFVSNAYSADGKLVTGASPAAMVAMLEGLGADAIGLNCSLGPKALKGILDEYLKNSSLPVILKPNAGLPKIVNGKTVFDVDAEEFSTDMAEAVRLGARIVGGCCGTTPEYISALKEKTSDIKPVPVEKKEFTLVSSYTHACIFDKEPVLIGERINPTGKKRFKEALKEKDIDYILREGISQEEKGVHILDVNVGLPEIDEAEMLTLVVAELQSVTNLPLQIDTSNASAMEKALRRYNGKALINSVNGKKESMDAIFPLAKKYGGVIIALTLDEHGIPDTAEGRFEIAKKILSEAEKYGIDKKDIIFDTLALTISSDKNAANETLRALSMIKNELKCHTSLGVSNISFGLPMRDAVNSTFFTLALANGLSAAIINPYSAEMMKAYYAYRALSGFDENCEKYIEFSQNIPANAVATIQTAIPSEVIKEDTRSELQNSIIKGLKERAASLTSELLKTEAPLSIIQNEIIPALNTVGEGFEKKTVYLPTLLICAETAKVAFEVIKNAMPSEKTADKCSVVIATVKGDIHDIGKNIVKLLLENYGFAVYDLGKDVPPEAILAKVTELKSPIAALSALMTTTVPAMQETIALLKEKAPYCKIIVGGAVLTQEYANEIKADYYAKDAMEGVRHCEEINRTL